MIPIVIVSVLKPSDEVRMYKRIGISLAKTNKYDVNIIGIESKKREVNAPNIFSHTLRHKGRSLLSRILNLVQAQKIITRLKPKIVIVTSPDLLYMVTHHRNKESFNVIYDLQEDYLKNITNQRVYSALIKQPLALIVRSLENRSIKRIQGLWLAEKTYQDDIPFCSNFPRKLLLENKYNGTLHQRKKYSSSKLSLLFTGTISTYSGIEEALTIYSALRQSAVGVTLTIVGICHLKSLRNFLQQLADSDANLKLVGLNEFVSHDEIVQNIAASDIGIIGYRPNTINTNKVPSKLYEYIAHKLPTIVEGSSSWARKLSDYNLDISVDFDQISGNTILERYRTIMQSHETKSCEACLWNSAEADLQSFTDTLVQ